MHTREQDLTTLGLLPTATQEEIKKAFHEKSLRYHPDKDSSPDAAENFQNVKGAYQRLHTNINAEEKLSAPPEKKIQKYKHFTQTDEGVRFDESLKFIDDFKGVLTKIINDFAYHKATEEDVYQFVRDNKEKFQEAVIISGSIDPLINVFLSPGNFELFLLLDPDWLKNLKVFNYPHTLNRFLIALEPNDWSKLFDDFLGGWLREYCQDLNNLATLFYNLPTSDKWTQEKDVTIETLLNHLGRTWLREIFFNEPNKLALLFEVFDSIDRIKPVLSFLNGDDRWIDSIMDGAGLGKILRSFNLTGDKYVIKHLLDQWDLITNYINLPNLTNPTQLNALLTNLIYIPFSFEPPKKNNIQKYTLSSTINIELFLKKYLPDFLKCDFKQLIQLLTLTHNKGEDTSTYAFVKNLGIVRAFSNDSLYKMFFLVENESPTKVRTVKEIVSSINQYKNETFYTALVLAVAKGFYHKLELEPENTSLFGYKKEDKLKSAESLINSILSDAPLDKKNFPSLSWGDLGEISALYSGDTSLVDSLKHFLLGKPAEVSQPALKLTHQQAASENKSLKR